MKTEMTARAATLTTDDRFERLESQVQEMRLEVRKLRISNGRMLTHWQALRAVWLDGLSALNVEMEAPDTDN